MDHKISVVINTLNDESSVERAINSVKWANEVIVCDMHSEDKTVELAKKLGARVYSIKRQEYVELARNFAISKASGDWVLVLDPDEEITPNLRDRLIESLKFKQIDFVRIPRKNIIFGYWMKAAMWWPDYNIRFFKKDKIKWSNKIHRPPEALGEGLDLAPEEKWAIVHHHYQSVDQFLERMIRYTKIQASELLDEGYKFDWTDLVKKPLAEFLSRFFAHKGFEDGLHGLVLSLLQAFSQFIVYLRVWEQEKFKVQDIEFDEIKNLSRDSEKEINYWIRYGNLSTNPFKRLIQKAKNRF